MPSTNPFTEEGRTRFKNFQKRVVSLLLIWLFLGLLGAGGFVWYKMTRGLPPLQSLYFRQYLRSMLRSALPFAKKPTQYVLLVRLATNPATAKDVVLGVNDRQASPVLDDSGKWISNKKTGPMFRLDPKLSAKKLYWTATVAPDEQMNTWLRQNVYEGAGLLGLFYPGLIIAGGVFGLGSALSILVDRKVNRRYAEGELVRGTRKLTPREYKAEMKEVVTGVGVYGVEPVKRGPLARRTRSLLRIEDHAFWMGVPLAEEAEHILMLGDSGVGKTQLIHNLLVQIAARPAREAAIIYDPACEFLQRHFDERRGDVILNPLDTRCPYWSPVSEVSLMTDRMMLAESFFPGHHDGFNATAKFFSGAGRSIFGRLLEFEPTPEEMVRCLRDAELIDRLVAGTEHAHYLDHGAGNQRGGVLATLAEAAAALKLLPRREETNGEIVLSEWARKRRGWIFITSTKDTRDALRPLHSVFIDLLMKRLMSVPPEWGMRHPCWVFVDEVHALKRLPALHDGLSEGRKYGLKIGQGTQNKNDYEEYYGKLARKMLAAPHTKYFFRSNESESAKWVADMIGEAEHERTKIGTTASVEDKGRDAINYSTETLRRAVVSKEEVMALDKMHAYLKYGDRVVPFRFNLTLLPNRVEGFLPRRVDQPAPRLPDLWEEKKGAETGGKREVDEKQGKGRGKSRGGKAGSATAGKDAEAGGEPQGRPGGKTSADETTEDAKHDDTKGYEERRKIIASARAMLESTDEAPEVEHPKRHEKLAPNGTGSGRKTPPDAAGLAGKVATAEETEPADEDGGRAGEEYERAANLGARAAEKEVAGNERLVDAPSVEKAVIVSGEPKSASEKGERRVKHRRDQRRNPEDRSGHEDVSAAPGDLAPGSEPRRKPRGKRRRWE